MIHPQLPLILGALLFSAFFSGMQMAYLSASKLQLELQEKQDSITGRIITHFSTRQARLTATLLIGNVFALVLFGIGMARILLPILTANLPAAVQYPAVLILIQTLITAVLALVIAEFIPRSLFMIRANAMLNILAVPLLVSYYILYPVVFLVVGAIRLVAVKILKMEFSEEKPVFGLTDVEQFMRKSLYQPETERVPEIDARIFHNALEFRTVKVRECMVPRTEIEAIELNEPIEALREAFIQTGHSKILIYQDTIDNVAGYCHQLAMFQKPADIATILTPMLAVPETMLASELFVKFVAEHRSIALVVDEFGGTSGLVTTEDLLEEIIGEIHDEFDEESLLEQELEPDLYLFSARQEIDYLNDKFNLDLPCGDYETLGGLILEMHGDIPSEGTIIQAPPYVITILSMDENRINTVQLERQTEPDEAGQTSK